MECAKRVVVWVGKVAAGEGKVLSGSWQGWQGGKGGVGREG